MAIATKPAVPAARLRFGAVWEGSTDNQQRSENAVFGHWTPCAEFTATVVNAAVVDKLVQGKKYYVKPLQRMPPRRRTISGSQTQMPFYQKSNADYQRSLANSATAEKALLADRAAAEKAFNDKKLSLDDRLFGLKASPEEKLAQLREREFAATNDLLDPILLLIFAQEDLATSALKTANDLAAATAKAEQIAGERGGLQREFLQLIRSPKAWFDMTS